MQNNFYLGNKILDFFLYLFIMLPKELYVMEQTRLISSHEAADRLQVHHKTISRLMRRGKLGAVKVANRWLIQEADVENFARTYVGKKGRPKGWSPKKKEAGR